MTVREVRYFDGDEWVTVRFDGFHVAAIEIEVSGPDDGGVPWPLTSPRPTVCWQGVKIDDHKNITGRDPYPPAWWENGWPRATAGRWPARALQAELGTRATGELLRNTNRKRVAA